MADELLRAETAPNSADSFDAERAALNRALEQASEENHLASYYRDCVRPLLRQPRTQWPGCCGGGCEPCAATLVIVAERTLEILGRSDPI